MKTKISMLVSTLLIKVWLKSINLNTSWSALQSIFSLEIKPKVTLWLFESKTGRSPVEISCKSTFVPLASNSSFKSPGSFQVSRFSVLRCYNARLFHYPDQAGHEDQNEDLHQEQAHARASDQAAALLQVSSQHLTAALRWASLTVRIKDRA